MFSLFIGENETELKLKDQLKKTEDDLEQCKKELNESIAKYRTLVSSKTTTPSPNNEMALGLLQSKLSETSSDLANVERLLHDAMAINEELRNENERLKRPNSGTESSPISPEEKPNSFPKSDDLEAQLALCKKELNDAVTKYRLLIIDMSKTRESDKQTTKAISDKFDELKKMTEQRNQEHDQEIAIWEHKLAGCNKACKQKDDLIQQLKENIRNMENDRLNDLKGIASAHVNHKDLTAKEYRNLVDEVERLTDINDQLADQLKDALDRIKILESNMQTTNNRCDDLTNKNQDLSREVERLIDELGISESEKEEIKSELKTTRQRNVDLTRQLETLEEKLSHSKSQHAQLVKEMKNYRESQGSMMDTFRSSMGSMDDQISTLRNEYQIMKTERETALIEINTLRKEIVEYRSNDTKIEQSRDAAVAAAAAASRQVESLMKEISTREESFRSERNALMTKVEDLMTELQSKKDENTMMVRRIDKAIIDKNLEISNLMSVHQAETEAYKNEVNRLKDSVSRLQFLKESLEQELHALRERQSIDRATIDDLERTKQQQRERIEDLTHTIISLKNDLATANAIKDHAEEEAKTLRDELAKMRSKLTELERALAALQSAKNSMQQGYEQRLREVGIDTESVTVSLGETKETLRSLERERETLRARNIELQEETKRLQSEKDLALTMVAEHKNKIVELHEHTHTFTRQRLNPELQDKIDHLTRQLQKAQALSLELQEHMVPEEETVVTKTSSQRETSHDTQEKKTANVKVGVAQDVGR